MRNDMAVVTGYVMFGDDEGFYDDVVDDVVISDIRVASRVDSNCNILSSYIKDTKAEREVVVKVICCKCKGDLYHRAPKDNKEYFTMTCFTCKHKRRIYKTAYDSIRIVSA